MVHNLQVVGPIVENSWEAETEGIAFCKILSELADGIIQRIADNINDFSFRYYGKYERNEPEVIWPFVREEGVACFQVRCHLRIVSVSQCTLLI